MLSWICLASHYRKMVKFTCTAFEAIFKSSKKFGNVFVADDNDLAVSGNWPSTSPARSIISGPMTIS